MKPVNQTRLHKGLFPIEDRGNCFPACIASILEMEVEDVIQIQEHYDNPNWNYVLADWLNERGYIWRSAEDGEDLSGKYVLAIGGSPRFQTETHVVIYLNGELAHDPHPDKTGITDVREIEVIEPLHQMRQVQTD